LAELFATFPFATPADESAALAIVMTALLRRVLPAAPICCISASTPATGKSLMADCVAVLATGRRASVVAIGKDGEELEKRIDAILLKGDAVACFDNVDRAVKSDVLCQVATQGHKSVRILAQSRIVECPTNVCLMMTGNNLTLLGDLARRSLVSTLDAGMERPEERSFERDAIEYAIEQRPKMIRAALILAKGYLEAGAPDVGATPYGSFETWDRMVRRPLVWAGWPDPLVAAAGMREQDHEVVGMADFLLAWHEALGETPIYAADLLEAIQGRESTYSEGLAPTHRALHDAAEMLFGSTHKLDAQGLAGRLRRWAGRIIGQHRVVRGDRTKRGYPWRVEHV
jgi:putative DNA primase/helicase